MQPKLQIEIPYVPLQPTVALQGHVEQTEWIGETMSSLLETKAN